MTRTCPSEDELARCVDRDLSQEAAQRIADHVATCAGCASQHAGLLALRERLSRPLVQELDVQAHLADVMSRLDAPRPGRSRARAWLPAALAGLCVFVAGALGVRYFSDSSARDAAANGFAARGGGAPATIARDVGVQAYASGGDLRPLVPGDVIAPDTPLTAGFRNLGKQSVFLLLFAIDARHALHWIAPAYTNASHDPVAEELVASASERLLPTTVVFDDLPPGPLRVVSVISARALRVSEIEALAAGELDPAAITRRLPQAEVRESRLQVRVAKGAAP